MTSAEKEKVLNEPQAQRLEDARHGEKEKASPNGTPPSNGSANGASNGETKNRFSKLARLLHALVNGVRHGDGKKTSPNGTPPSNGSASLKGKQAYAAHALSPLDGRYAKEVGDLSPYFSEYAWMRYRWRVECRYLKALLNTLPTRKAMRAKKKAFAELDAWEKGFGEATMARIQAIESETKHDVKAVEYALKEKVAESQHGLEKYVEYVHFGLTSQDVNHTALPWMLKDAHECVLMPRTQTLINTLGRLATAWEAVPMLARTHGQAASPTRLGKEIHVFYTRLREQANHVHTIPFSAKFGGATGNFNAHEAAFPKVDWHAFADTFIHSLSLKRSYPTTQIEHYDSLGNRLHAWASLMTIAIDLCRDMWLYIMMDYFTLKTQDKEVGSSAMPHKINPIDFENAEGNAEIARALLTHLAQKLPISRLQRDLTDSTASRNVGLALGYALLALSRIQVGLNKLRVNEARIAEDLRAHPEVIAEAVQTILRREGYPQPYEALKALSRNKRDDFETRFEAFLKGLEVSDSVKAELRALRPETYLGR